MSKHPEQALTCAGMRDGHIGGSLLQHGRIIERLFVDVTRELPK